jgi:IS1 family transposase
MWRIISQCIRFNQRFLRNLKVFFLQFDELFSFIKTRKNRQWIWTCIDVSSRLFLGFVVGKRKKKLAKKMMKTVKSRIDNNPIVITSDGLPSYTDLIPEFFPGILYEQVVKKYKGRKIDEIEQRAIVGKLEKIVQVIKGLKLGKVVNTSFIERLNLTLRHSINSLGRKVLFFAKTYLAIIGKLHIMSVFYNFTRPHMSLKGRTPAMAAGITDRVWSLYEVLTYRDYE